MRNTISSLAELVAAHGRNWLELAHQADQAAMKLGGAEMPLDFTSSWREPPQAGGATVDRDASTPARVIEFRGYAYTRTPSRISGDLVTTYDPKTPQIWRVPLRDQVKVAVSATVPLGGYVIPAAFTADIAPRLEAHGVGFSRLRGGEEKFRAQAFHASEVRFSAAPFEGRMRAAGGSAFRPASTGLLRRVGLVQCVLRTKGTHGTLCRRADCTGNARP
jgi:hypothetical protein